MGSVCSTERSVGDRHPAKISSSGVQARDRTMQNGRKPLGMHISAIRKFLADHPDVSAQSLTTSQTNKAIVKPETVGTNRPYIDKYCGQTDMTGVDLIAPATVFVSHAWKYSLVDTVVDVLEQHAAKEPNAYFWFDLFTNDQNAVASKDFDWFSNTFKGSIRDIGVVLVILSPWNAPIPIGRAWCLFEISTALIDDAVELMIYLPGKEVTSMSSSVQEDTKCLIQALSDIQAEKAGATSEEDKSKIFSVIRNSTGGFSSVNNHVKTKLREWYVDQLRDIVSKTKDDESLQDAVGNIFAAFGLFDEGLQHIEQSLSIRLSKYGEHHSEVATSYSHLAAVYRYKGDANVAMDYSQKSLSIRLSIHGEQHPDVAESYNRMAVLYKTQGDLEKASEYFQKSLSIRLSALGENHIDVAHTYNNMAVVYKEKGELERSLEYYKKSLSLSVDILGEHHPDVAQLYNNMGSVYCQQGYLITALAKHQRSLAIRLSVFGENHPTVAGSYNNLAYVYQRKTDYNMALEYHHKSLSVRFIIVGEQHPDVATSYNNIACVYRDKGDLDKAMEYHQTSLSMRLSILGDQHPDVARSYNNIGRLHGLRGDLDESLRYYQKSLSMKLSILGEHHPEVNALYKQIGQIHEKKGDDQLAQEYFSKSEITK